MPYIGKQPSNVPVTAADIPDNSITAAKIIDGAITVSDIANDAITADKLADSINAEITANTAKTGITSSQASAITANTAKTGITTSQANAITANTAKTGITSSQANAITANTSKVGITSSQASAITANTAKVTNSTNASDLTSGTLPDARFPSALPAIDGSSLTGITTDTTTIENNVAMLGFYRAADHSKAKYNLVDQVIDDYNDATGIDASASTNEELTSGVYRGSVTGSTTGATGGTLSAIGSTTLHTFTSNGNFSAPNTGTAEILLVGGGGTGGNNKGGGGSGGNVYPNSSQAITGGTTYAIVVGAGGVHPNGSNTNYTTVPSASWAGASTTAFSRTAVGGNHGRAGDSRTPYGNGTGHQGGRGSGNILAGSYSGNTGGQAGNDSGGGGAGDGANGGSAPSNNAGGDGGAGTQNNIDGNNYYWGGGGGGSALHRDNSSYSGGDGGAGGGGAGVGGGTAAGGGSARNAGDNIGLGAGGGGNGGANTGGGGGGAGTAGGAAGGTGGSGIVMVKYTTSAQYGTAPGDLVLQSTANTASTAPTTGDVVLLIENAAGTATLNTDVKGFVSRNGGSTFTQGTLTDEGSWGTNKKILAFHDLDISGQSSGTDIRYKITTHNQSASKETKIHATSLAWA